MINTHIFCQTESDRAILNALSALRTSVKVYDLESLTRLADQLNRDTLVLIYPEEGHHPELLSVPELRNIAGNVLIISSKNRLADEDAMAKHVIELTRSDELLKQALYLIQKLSVQLRRKSIIDNGMLSLIDFSKAIDTEIASSDLNEILEELHRFLLNDAARLQIQKTNQKDLCDHIVQSMTALLPENIRLNDKIQKIGIIKCDAGALVRSITETLLTIIGHTPEITGLTMTSDILPGLPGIMESVVSLRFLVEKNIDQRLHLDRERLEEVTQPLEYLILQHGGELYVHQNMKDAIQVEINLPSPTRISKKQKSAAKEKTLQTILVVDDEEVIRELISDVLPEEKYKVLTAADGVEGLELFEKHQDVVDLVILDIVMPRMDGRQLFESIKKIKPELKVVITSGYSKASVRDKLALSDVAAFFPKPFVIEDLMELVNNLL